MKTIVVDIDHSQTLAARLGYAHQLATAYGAHLVVSHTLPLATPFLGDGYGATVSAELASKMLDAERAEADKLRHSAQQELADLGPTWEWVQDVGDKLTNLVDLSKLADLVIVGPSHARTRSSQALQSVGSQLSLYACAPVMILPEKPASFNPNAPIMVGWNGSEEAAHAVKVTLPLLKSVPQVIVIEVHEDEKEKMPDLDIGAYLARHGIKVHLSREAVDGTIAQTLERAAQRFGVSMIVAGAYGRTRLIEYVFGGVSRSFVNDPALPVVLMH